MSNCIGENRVSFLTLPAEIHLEILSQLIEFQGNREAVANKWLLKDIRL